jgi:hypothetical protein
MTALSRLALERYGGRLQEFSLDLTATTVPQPLIQADGERVMLTIINSGTTVAWLRIGRPGAAGTGLRLPASGGGVTFDALEDPLVIGQAMYLVVAADTATIEAFGARRIGSE